MCCKDLCQMQCLITCVGEYLSTLLCATNCCDPRNPSFSRVNSEFIKCGLIGRGRVTYFNLVCGHMIEILASLSGSWLLYCGSGL